MHESGSTPRAIEKIVVLGGAGQVGEWVTRDLAARGTIDEVVLADINLERAEAIASDLKTQDCPVTVVDVADGEDLQHACSGASLVMDCTSFGSSEGIELAMTARSAYADLVSNRTPDELARLKAGPIAVITGLGLSPGLAAVLARHASEAFDVFEEFQVYFVSIRPPAPTRGGLDTITWELGSQVDERGYFLNGRWLPTGPMEGSQRIDFGAPLGEHVVYVVPHPEPRDLPRAFPTLRHCSVKGTWQRELMDDFRVLHKYGLLQPDTLPQTKETIWRNMGGQRHSNEGVGVATGVIMEAAGLHDGRWTTRRYNFEMPADWGAEAMSRVTGVCAAVGAELLASESHPDPGLLSSESFYDPEEFLTGLHERGSVRVTWEDTPA